MDGRRMNGIWPTVHAELRSLADDLTPLDRLCRADMLNQPSPPIDQRDSKARASSSRRWDVAR